MDEQDYTIKTWCAKHQVSRATFYNHRKAGKGPRIMKVGQQTRISRQADADWQREREAAAETGRAA